MNNAVTWLMKYADNYALLNRISPSDAETFAARQALEAELVRLFTPLSDEQIENLWHSTFRYETNSIQTLFRLCENEHGIGDI